MIDVAKRLSLISLSVVFILTGLMSSGFCQTPQANTTDSNPLSSRAQQHVEKAIHMDQQSQERRTHWEQEKIDLVNTYEQLVQQKQFLETENKTLSEQQKYLQTLNQTMTRQIEDSIRVQEELSPFLTQVYEQLDTFIASDAAFLEEERSTRLATLDKIMKDPQVTIAEKYRKVMEALFIEAEYGSTIEVYQDRIQLGSKEQEATLGNIFRLGRICLFFLSLDQSICGVFNPAENTWQKLSDKHLPAIRSAVEIGNKRKPAELVPLPIGRLAVPGGGK